MDFPQQVEETLVERPTEYDVTMEPILTTADIKEKIDDNSTLMMAFQNLTNKQQQQQQYLQNDYKNNIMTSSVGSILDDTTPSDSGVQLLDSESSELMIESITSQNGFELIDDNRCSANQLPDLVIAISDGSASNEQNSIIANGIITKMDLENSNTINNTKQPDLMINQITGNNRCDDIMTASNCSTFDTTENIVYRRKAKKLSGPNSKAPKKRVSFHEDILKNTRTDNIHIEHGFITYKNGRKSGVVAGRYSWCSEGDAAGGGQHKQQQQLHQTNQNENQSCQIVYRNACSDVLDYGNADIYENVDSNHLKYDNSGIFEYHPQQQQKQHQKDSGKMKDLQQKPVLYKCSCSSSNSSLDSDETGGGTDKNSNHNSKYSQAKSSSCDCIGMNNTNNNFIGDNCYFSEPNINDDDNNDGFTYYNESSAKTTTTLFRKSVWSKEKKPKTSCLKKTKSKHTNVIEEYDLNTKMKKFNVHDMNQLIDNSKMIFGSLKSIFSIPLPERGVPEGSEDIQSVYECIPENENIDNHELHQLKNHNKHYQEDIYNNCYSCSPANKARPFLSKSLDGGPKTTTNDTNKFVHNVDDQLRRKNEMDLYAPTRQNSDDEKVYQQIQDNETYNDNFNKKSLEKNENNNNGNDDIDDDDYNPSDIVANDMQQIRNKYIINCESTVFEHTGVSYSYETAGLVGANGQIDGDAEFVNSSAKPTPIAEAPNSIAKSLIELNPIKQTFVNIFKTLKDTKTITSPTGLPPQSQQSFDQLKYLQKNDIKKKLSPVETKQFNENQIIAQSLIFSPPAPPQQQQQNILLERKLSKDELFRVNPKGKSISSGGSSDKQSIYSDTTSNNYDNMSDISWHKLTNNFNKNVVSSPTKVFNNKNCIDKIQATTQNRHLASPLRKQRSNGNNGVTRFERLPNTRMSPDLFNFSSGGGSGRESKSTILSEEFDDILTITTTTTDTDKNDSDIVIIDYPENLTPEKALDCGPNIGNSSSGISSLSSSSYLKPPKSNLLNRFLRNVTQKKILESSIRKNNFFASKIRNENKLLTGNLYVKGAKPKNQELIEDLNAEIAMEIEMSGVVGSPRRELSETCGIRGTGNGVDNNGSLESEISGDISRFELGIGEISIDIFNGNCLHILRDDTEILMKVFKLYTGYTREGFMTPVLVFLTDKALYVTDLVRNCLCNKLILPYSELDVILMGPYGNTVLLCNGTRDMQQVLLAGGPYPADGLVANLELCARRSGSVLPAVGQLTLGHLAPLQTFVRENSSVSKNDNWLYYAVINVPAGTLGNEQEPLGPNVKGFLMHRRLYDNGSGSENWHAGYFLLKAGVLYMFNDSSQKLPTWAMALAECQGARRAVKTGRPHCFEILLKHDILQLAAPDEYVASEWLQALVQSASGLFEMQEKHKTLGCTMIMTANHLITLREDFTSPLKGNITKPVAGAITMAKGAIKNSPLKEIFEPNEMENNSAMSSVVSTPSITNTHRSNSSVNSTPSKSSIISRSTNTTTTNNLTGDQLLYHHNNHHHHQNKSTAINYDSDKINDKNSHTNMTSFYGKNSGIEVLTCATIKEMTGIRIPSHDESWWCILEFSCQEVRETSDDLVIFFASSSEMQRFLRMLEQLWQAKNNDLFPITILDEDDLVSEQCTKLYMDINRSWEPLLSAALGYPL